MSYQLVDNIRGKVLQEFATKAEAEKAFNHQSCEADLSIVEPVKKTTPKKKVANVKKESN